MTPDQLPTSEKTKARSKMVNDIQESRRLDWEQANESKINEMCLGNCAIYRVEIYIE